ncbi:MAG: family 78 glycoside hydrolase catalytic domain [Armatimonadota bacterium]|nr:glycoside hydrolase family 78 protein [Armatimonadota bacterium]MDW8026416.1 family 78 glycoside hydrolase catalytic domain [Armatimonadota bacterium]
MAAIVPSNLRCEYRINPVGIDVGNPRLSWTLESKEHGARGKRQSAYRILVASSLENLNKDIGDLWDTGKVESDETTHITYAGKPLKSLMQCWWKVMVWDEQGKPSDWSKPAFWIMGLLEPNEWRAKWIGYDEPAEFETSAFVGARWIWFPEGDPRKEAPKATRYFRRSFKLQEGARVIRARISITADDQFILFVNGVEVGRSDGKRDAWRRPRNFDLLKHIRVGINAIAISVTNEGGPAGLLARLVIEFEGAQQTTVVTDSKWRASEREVNGWIETAFDDSGWKSAVELGAYGVEPWGYIGDEVPPLPYLRKTFTVNGDVMRALMFVSALGSCEVRVNGKRICEDYFIPGWSDFRKRAYYRAYDVTGLLRRGANAIGAILHDEWYSGFQGGWGRRNFYGGEPRLLIQLHIQLDDGTEQIIVTDETWKASYGPIIAADFYMGMIYDARREKLIEGFDTPNFDDGKWKPVVVTERVPLQLTWHPGEPVKKEMELPARSIVEIKPNTFVFDIGQNMVGVARLKVRGAKPGTQITMRFAEVLNPDGTIHTANLRRAKNTDVYICKGNGEEVFEPRFTFRGFRYVEVTGYPGKPEVDAITGVVLRSDVPLVGEFECSNAQVNRLFQNIVWGLRGNYLEVPTDCPQRDERQGWTGDAQIFVFAASYIADIASFMTKWLIDLNDGQRADGAYPDVAPTTGAGFGTPAWGDAGIIIPWAMLKVYGDKRIVERHYNSMMRYIEYLLRNSKNLIRPAIGYGDWVPAGADTPKDVLATAYFAYVTKLMAEMAKAIGRGEDAKRYEKLFDEIKAAFIKEFVQGDGRIKGDTQTCYALALNIGLLPDELRPRALEHLVRDIEKRGWHLSTGFVGTRHLMLALSECDRSDVAYRLLLQDTYPSWLFMVKMGATTIWERWNSIQPDGSIHEPGMNSFNHYAFGSVGEWMFRVLAGIDTLENSFKRTLIKPSVSDGLDFVRASYNSIRGRIDVEWRKEGNNLRLKITIPVNVVAIVRVPTSDASKVMESGMPAADSPGVKFVRAEDGIAVFEIGSGVYEFVTPLK